MATVNSSLKSGWTAGPKVAAGHALVEILIFLLVAGGLSVVAQQYSRYIAIAGGPGAHLFWHPDHEGQQERYHGLATKNKIGNPYLAGVLTSAANPYFWIWWLSIGSALLIDGLRARLDPRRHLHDRPLGC